MLPFCRIDKNNLRSVGVEISYGYLDCGHKALCLNVGLVWWMFTSGIELGS